MDDFFVIFKIFDNTFVDDELKEIKFLCGGKVFKKDTVLDIIEEIDKKINIYIFIYCHPTKFKKILDKLYEIFNKRGVIFEGSMVNNSSVSFQAPNTTNNKSLDIDIEKQNLKSLEDEKKEAIKEACDEFLKTTSEPNFTILCNIILNSPETLAKVQQYFSHGTIEYEKINSVDEETYENFEYQKEYEDLISLLGNYGIPPNCNMIKHYLIKEEGCLPIVLRTIFHHYLQGNCIPNKS